VFCSKCGSSLPEGSGVCGACGSIVSTAGVPITPGTAGAPQTSGLAIASLICGLLFFAFPLALAAVILGHVSLSQIRKSGGHLKGRGLALGGTILGYLGLSIVPVLIIAAIAIPNLLRARIAANESSAVGSVRSLTEAEATFARTGNKLGYACALADLSTAGVLAPKLASGQHSGYILELRGCSSETAGGPHVKYQVVAYPIAPNQSGVRAFCSDQEGIIKFDPTGSPQACLETGSPLR
jgi:type IV pilus assembly protein PilA